MPQQFTCMILQNLTHVGSDYRTDIYNGVAIGPGLVMETGIYPYRIKPKNRIVPGSSPNI